MMQLQLMDEDGKMVCEVDNDSAVLDSYPVKDGYRIHVSRGVKNSMISGLHLRLLPCKRPIKTTDSQPKERISKAAVHVQ